MTDLAGPVWGIAVVGMLAVLLVVFARRIRQDGAGSGRLVVIGVAIGLGVAGLATAVALLGR